MLPHLNNCKYLGKDRLQNEGEMKDFCGELEIIDFNLCTVWIPLGFHGQGSTFAFCSSTRVPASLSPACSLRPLSALHIILQPPYREGQNSLGMTWLPSAKPCYILRREHPLCLEPTALQEKSDKESKMYYNRSIPGYTLKSEEQY